MKLYIRQHTVIDFEKENIFDISDKCRLLVAPEDRF